MAEREKFIETLQSVSEMAKGLDAPLTKEEIQAYFSELNLSSEQLEMVYQYILHPQVESNSSNEDISNENISDEDSSNEDSTENKMTKSKQENSKFLEMYLEDLRNLKRLSTTEEQKLYTMLTDGDVSVMQPITDHWLPKVVEMARTYEKYNVNIEDLIQEGNIGLITAIDELLGKKKILDVSKYVKESVQKALEDYVDEVSGESDWTNAVIAKATLIEEAKQAFAEEHVKIPTAKELSDYTKIPVEEIEDILKLSLDEIKKENEKTSQVQKSNTLKSPWDDMKYTQD